MNPTVTPFVSQENLLKPTRWPVEKEAECPVVEHWVTLHAFEVTLEDSSRSAIADPTCSNIKKCVEAHGSIEHIESCLLRNLDGQTRTDHAIGQA
jgi:hypothetical protein